MLKQDVVDINFLQITVHGDEYLCFIFFPYSQFEGDQQQVEKNVSKTDHSVKLYLLRNSVTMLSSMSVAKDFDGIHA